MNKAPKRRRRQNAGAAGAVQRAIQMHRAGKLKKAKSAYQSILAVDDESVDALHYYGVLQHQMGDSTRAVELITRAVKLKPDNADAHNNLGNVLKEIGRLDAAADAYQACLNLQSGHRDALNNLGAVYKAQHRHAEALQLFEQVLAKHPRDAVVLLNQGRVLAALDRNDEAEASYRKSLQADRTQGQTYISLGKMLAGAGREPEAKGLFEQWLEFEPDNSVAQHLLAAYGGQEIPQRASDAYVTETFDEFASTFDANLEQLDYRGPELIADAAKRVIGKKRNRYDVLDAGCGTGLIAPLIKDQARSLTGVDLSQAMVKRALALKLYSALTVQELSRFMRENQNKYDLILCADTLCYFGALEDVFSAAFLSLRGSGWLVFTVEALTKPGVDETYRLNQHGRYCHAQLYVQQCLQAAGFSLHSESVEILRKESGQPVDGLVIVAAKGQRQANRTWLQRLLGNAAENS